jgi:hypothetical protein
VAIARCRTASGLWAGIPSPCRWKALRSDGQVVPNTAAAALTLPQPLGQRKGAFGLGPVGEEAAGLPAQRTSTGDQLAFAGPQIA